MNFYGFSDPFEFEMLVMQVYHTLMEWGYIENNNDDNVPYEVFEEIFYSLGYWFDDYIYSLLIRFNPTDLDNPEN
jgi:hypothetical protein